MAKTQHHVADLMTMWEATFFEFPIAGAKWAWGVGKEPEVAEAAWKGYDAWVRLTSASIDESYRNPLFGEIAARSLDRGLRWQRLSQALAGAFFAGLWPAVGLPTAAAMEALSEELRSLTARLKAQDAQIQALRAELRVLIADPRLAVSLQANGKLATHPPTSLREERHSPPAGLLVQSKKNAARTTDLSEYFEPAAADTRATPGPGQREGNEREAIPKLDVQTEAVQTEVPRTAYSLPPWPPDSRAGGRAANKKAAKGNTLR